MCSHGTNLVLAGRQASISIHGVSHPQLAGDDEARASPIGESRGWEEYDSVAVEYLKACKLNIGMLSEGL